MLAARDGHGDDDGDDGDDDDEGDATAMVATAMMATAMMTTTIVTTTTMTTTTMTMTKTTTVHTRPSVSITKLNTGRHNKIRKERQTLMARPVQIKEALNSKLAIKKVQR